MEHFGVRFPKQNYVSTPSSEVTRLGKVKAGMEQAPKPPAKKLGTFRTLEEVELCRFIFISVSDRLNNFLVIFCKT